MREMTSDALPRIGTTSRTTTGARGYLRATCADERRCSRRRAPSSAEQGTAVDAVPQADGSRPETDRQALVKESQSLVPSRVEGVWRWYSDCCLRVPMSIASDVRLALRTLRRRPAFTLLACAILPLGIGASTAMFSVGDAVLIRPLPYHHSDSLAF